MRNSARSFRGLLLLSGFILTIHTLVPHVHGSHYPAPDKASISPTQELTGGWLDILADFVDAEMGEDHLEHFSPEKTMDLVLVVPSIIPALLPVLFAERYFLEPDTDYPQCTRFSSSGPVIQEVHLSRIVPRGPPVVA